MTDIFNMEGAYAPSALTVDILVDLISSEHESTLTDVAVTKHVNKVCKAVKNFVELSKYPEDQIFNQISEEVFGKNVPSMVGRVVSAFTAILPTLTDMKKRCVTSFSYRNDAMAFRKYLDNCIYRVIAHKKEITQEELKPLDVFFFERDDVMRILSEMNGTLKILENAIKEQNRFDLGRVTYNTFGYIFDRGTLRQENTANTPVMQPKQFKMFENCTLDDLVKLTQSVIEINNRLEMMNRHGMTFDKGISTIETSIGTVKNLINTPYKVEQLSEDVTDRVKYCASVLNGVRILNSRNKIVNTLLCDVWNNIMTVFNITKG